MILAGAEKECSDCVMVDLISPESSDCINNRLTLLDSSAEEVWSSAFAIRAIYNFSVVFNSVFNSLDLQFTESNTHLGLVTSLKNL